MAVHRYIRGWAPPAYGTCESFDFAPLGLRSGRTGGDDRPFPNLNKGGFHRKASVLVKCLQSQYEKGSPVSINTSTVPCPIKADIPGIDFIRREGGGGFVVNVCVHVSGRSHRGVAAIDIVLVFDDELIGFVEQ